jgi:hypothetical protein
VFSKPFHIRYKSNTPGELDMILYIRYKSSTPGELGMLLYIRYKSNTPLGELGMLL